MCTSSPGRGTGSEVRKHAQSRDFERVEALQAGEMTLSRSEPDRHGRYAEENWGEWRWDDTRNAVSPELVKVARSLNGGGATTYTIERSASGVCVCTVRGA